MLTRPRKKVFEYKTHKLAPEIDIHFDSSNEDVFKTICTYIVNCRRELKNRIIDDREFMVIGKHVDWKKMRAENSK